MKRSLLLLVLLVLAVSGILLWRSREQATAQRDEAALPSAPAPAAPEATLTAGELSAPVSVELARELPLERRAIDPTPTGVVRGAAMPVAAAGLRVIGRVQDESGAPVEGVKVRAGEGPFEFQIAFEQATGEEERERYGRATTDSDGRFTLELRRPGDVTLRLRAARHAPLDVPRSIPAGELYDAGTFTLIAGPIVTGRVVESRGAGVGGARISRTLGGDPNDGILWVVDGSSGEALGETRADGSFELDILPAGELELSVESDEHPTLRYKLDGSLRAAERRDG